MIYKKLVKLSMALLLSTGMCASMPVMPVYAQTQEKVVTIGQKKNADYSFKIKNKLKGTIKGLRIKTSEEETFRANELKKKQAIKKNKYVKFNYQLFDGETDDTTFMLRIELKNGKIYTLTNFPMSAIHKQVTIQKKNGIVYLRYLNADGEYVSTYEQEKAALTTTNDDGTETVDTNETDEEEAEASQSDEQNVSGSDAMTSQPVTVIQNYNNSENANTSSEEQTEATNSQTTEQTQTTTDQNNSTTTTKPCGGVCINDGTSAYQECLQRLQSTCPAEGA